MATTLTATAQTGTPTTPPRVRLAIAGAPTPPANAYASNFATTVDGWTVSGPTGASVARIGSTLRVSGATGQPAGTVTTASRTLTGLTVGAAYLYRATVTTTDAQVRLGVTGGPSGSYVSTLPAPSTALLELSFTATATSHTITLAILNPTANITPILDVASVTVRPSGTWQGTTITRTDANGTRAVRVAAGTDVNASGALTVYDVEPALTGALTYTVRDGLGATTTSTVTLAEPAPWLTLPATTNATAGTVTAVPLVMLTDYRETSDSNGTLHTIIARADKVANPGPLSYRSGSFTIWAASYTDADTIRTALAGGEIALLRQPALASLDAFLYARRVSIAPYPEDVEGPRPWSVDVDFDEVAAP